jgi:histidinol-phosphate phosphatase family protein
VIINIGLWDAGFESLHGHKMDFISEIDASWSLFLDRDGVINERIVGGYVQNAASFRLLEGVAEAVAILKKRFGHIFVVTNQQGIGKKIMTKEDLQLVHNHMENVLSITFDGIYYSPFLACENSLMRKPNPGMAFEAKKDFPEIDFQKSVMVGDSVSDIQFGKNAGMKTVYISTQEENKDADMVCASLYDFAKRIF